MITIFLELLFCLIWSSGHKFIVDGQQRLISLTLLLMYLNKMQKQHLEEEDRTHLRYIYLFETKRGNACVV